MRKTFILAIAVLALSGCDKLGGGGVVNQFLGNWAELKLPAGCVAKQISAEESAGVVVLCEDGRLFH